MSTREPRRGLSSFFGSVVHPLLDRWRGGRAYQHVAAYRRFYDVTRDELLRRQTMDLRELLVHAYETTAFHRARMQAAGFEPERLEDARELARLPSLSRREVVERKAELLSDAFEPGALDTAQSGGTTASPVSFHQTQEAIARKDALAHVLKEEMGWFSGARAAYLWGAVRDLTPPIGNPLRRAKAAFVERYLERSLSLPAQTLNDEILDDYTERLVRFRPHVLQAYPGAADLLARRLLGRGIRLRVPMVLLTAEPTFDDQRKRIALALNAEVFTFYGSREVGWVAFECPAEHALHVNTAGVYLESNADGELLVTDLLNRAMPLIRYEIGDRGTLAEAPCPCGDPRPVLERLEGRVSDSFVLPSGRVVPGASIAVRGVPLEEMGILDIQVVQTERESVDVYWVPAPDGAAPKLDRYRDALGTALGETVAVRFHRVERLEPEPNGKIRYVKSLVSAP